MALETTSIALDADVVSEIAGAVADNSTIARLSPIKPMLFNDEKYLVFNGASEAEVVAEGAKKGSYEQSFSDPIIAQRYTIQTTTRVSDQLRWADEDDRLKIVESIIEDQRAAIGRAIDYIVYHAVSPKSGSAITGATALSSAAQLVEAQAGDTAADMLDALEAKLVDYDVNGIALARTFAAELRRLRATGTGTRLYPDIPMNVNALGNLDGIPAAVSGTVNGRLITPKTGIRAFLGDFTKIRWGLIRNMGAEIIPYGDPDGTGYDLKAYNQVAFRTEAVLGVAIIDPDAFAVLHAQEDEDESES